MNYTCAYSLTAEQNLFLILLLLRTALAPYWQSLVHLNCACSITTSHYYTTRPGQEAGLNDILCTHDDLVGKMYVMYRISETTCELRCVDQTTGLRPYWPPGLCPHIRAHHRRIFSHHIHTHPFHSSRTLIPAHLTYCKYTHTHTTFICNPSFISYWINLLFI